MSILIHNARLLTLKKGAIPRRSAESRELSVIERGYVRIDRDAISHVGAGDPPGELLGGETHDEAASQSSTRQKSLEKNTVIDAHGRVVMPAFVDAHTHASWAGDRLDEWDMKRAGASYLDILSAGGGIMSTVCAVRAATDDELVAQLDSHIDAMAKLGTAAVEVKSGYGLNVETEIKMLRAIEIVAAAHDNLIISSTALLGHAIDSDQSNFVSRTIEQTLPAVSEAFPRVPIDAYCEEGAWSVDDCRRLFEKAQTLGHSFRVHADQFNSLGMTPIAVEMGAKSVDHLEASTESDLKTLAESETFGVMLPACGFHLDDRYANGRLFMDMGGALVIASNYNPGSAPCFSMLMVVSLAVRKLGLTIEEAITACTVNAAALLQTTPEGLGTIDASAGVASLIMLRHSDERMLAYEFGGDPVDLVIAGGKIIKWTGGDHTRCIMDA